ncbi:MAG: hypothetical protein BWY04_01398 [candidate division CPR1 bacterium ADurb.Bin160]|jgi:hypothetical protein|uniref:Uncharacterized protein n=1 Tax=candidate division CPR1 bacterium ADurb.Bin160 TaxID=1852826 RepID=A0A1V5ZJA8_9BACT|nr:MAG: hypothetical protein BWY04_01398 [candidate division CPR1 bacterium ADurb.Bin160]
MFTLVVSTVSSSDSEITSIPHHVNIASDRENPVNNKPKITRPIKGFFIDISFFKNDKIIF